MLDPETELHGAYLLKKTCDFCLLSLTMYRESGFAVLA